MCLIAAANDCHDNKVTYTWVQSATLQLCLFQGWAACGPRAKCGLPKTSVWPAKWAANQSYCGPGVNECKADFLICTYRAVHLVTLVYNSTIWQVFILLHWAQVLLQPTRTYRGVNVACSPEKIAHHWYIPTDKLTHRASAKLEKSLHKMHGG